MEAKEIMNEECAAYLRKITMTYGLPPREGAFIKFASISANSLLNGNRAATQGELKAYLVANVHCPDEVAERYSEYYHWLVRAFLFQHGRNDIKMFFFEKPL